MLHWGKALTAKAKVRLQASTGPQRQRKGERKRQRHLIDFDVGSRMHVGIDLENLLDRRAKTSGDASQGVSGLDLVRRPYRQWQERAQDHVLPCACSKCASDLRALTTATRSQQGRNRNNMCSSSTRQETH